MAPSSKLAAMIQELAAWVRDARERTIELAADLSGEQLWGPRLPIVNPMIWEIGHMAWFQEKWVLRDGCGEAPLRADGDALYDSSTVPHDTRWELPLPSLDATLAYMRAVRDRVLEKLHEREADDQVLYYALYSVFHEDWHTEAFTYTRQTLGYPAPRLSGLPQRRPGAPGPAEDHEPWRGDVAVPGGVLMLGASPEETFAFDNEKWAHPVEVRPFTIARAPVTQSEFAAFVDDGGYRRKDLWDEEGWAWREGAGADHPVYWQRDAGGGWLRRDFDETVPLEAYRPAVHVNWHEAEAYCRWAGRRLPTEAEWEAAAAGEGEPSGERLSQQKRRFPWGSEPPAPHRANLDWQAMGCVGVAGLAGGDSSFGCRQMMGNVWEWTVTPFLPYPGFEPDMYRDNSQPWFGTRKVLRGGSWATRSRLVRNTLRNYFTPERRDVVAGFRTCGVSA